MTYTYPQGTGLSTDAPIGGTNLGQGRLQRGKSDERHLPPRGRCGRLGAVQPEQVLPMPRRKVISAMHDALCIGGDARNGSPADLAHAVEWTRRKLPGVGRREQDRAVLDSHGMYVELATVRVLLDERRVPRLPVEASRSILLPLVGAAEPLFS